jgi:allantoicase
LTIRYSETARARELGKTRDWVVIHYSRRGVHSQATVVTEYRGPLVGTRVVRGRERECFRLRWSFARSDRSA